MSERHDDPLQHTVTPSERVRCNSGVLAHQQRRASMDRRTGRLAAKRAGRDLDTRVVVQPLGLSRLAVRAKERALAVERDTHRRGDRRSISLI
jgi:hypothetical protein